MSFWLPALATQEISSSVYMGVEAKIIEPLPLEVSQVDVAHLHTQIKYFRNM